MPRFLPDKLVIDHHTVALQDDLGTTIQSFTIDRVSVEGALYGDDRIFSGEIALTPDERAQFDELLSRICRRIEALFGGTAT